MREISTARYISKETRTTSRPVAISDAIFAFAMTLLILSIEVPKIPLRLAPKLLGSSLIDLLPQFGVFIISFLVISFFWLNHSAVYSHIIKSSSILVIMNIFNLMAIVVIPFSTALVGDYGSVQIAVFFYESNIFLAGLFIALQWWYATKNRRLVDPELDSEHIRTTRQGILVIPVLSLLAMAISFVSPLWSLATYLLTPLVVLKPKK